MTRPSARARRKNETRQEIIDAGIEVFQEDGYRGATVDRIASRAGVSRATFYLHFEDKAALSMAIGMQALPAVIESFRALAEIRPVTRQAVLNWVREHSALIERYRTSYGVAFSASVSSDQFVAEDMKVTDAVAEAMSSYLDALSGAERASAKMRVRLLQYQTSYVLYELHVRRAPLDEAAVLDGIGEMWWREVGVTRRRARRVPRVEQERP